MEIEITIASSSSFNKNKNKLEKRRGKDLYRERLVVEKGRKEKIISKYEVILLSETPGDGFHFIFVNFTHRKINLETMRYNCQHFRVHVSFWG